jgi:diamine N-acetyltransferase
MDRQQPEEGAPFVNIIGELVALGPLRRDLPYQRWYSAFSTTRTIGKSRPMTVEEAEAWYERHAMNDREAHFTIYERVTWRPIGTTELTDIDMENRRAEFGIVIGESDSRGKGYGTETARLMLDYAFTARGLVNVMLIVNAYNMAGLRAYEKAGFREFGRRRQCRFMGGTMWDHIYMECIAAEFTSPVLSQVFVPDAVRS